MLLKKNLINKNKDVHNKIFYYNKRFLNKVGLVGKPNVGKSTLFNSIININNKNSIYAKISNFPFTTIEPNKSTIFLKDERLLNLKEKFNSKKIIYDDLLQVIDIAGLIKNASKGEGLGNQFLGDIRDVDFILHNIRCYKNDKIIHVDGVDFNPINDLIEIDNELLYADLEYLDKRINSKKVNANLKKNDNDYIKFLDICNDIYDLLQNGEKAIKILDKSIYKLNEINQLFKKFGLYNQLLTMKPSILILNVDEDGIIKGNEYVEMIKEYNENNENLKIIKLCSKLEHEISLIDDINEKNELMEIYNIKKTGLEEIINLTKNVLNIKSYFTVGEKETKSWNFNSNKINTVSLFYYILKFNKKKFNVNLK